MRARGQLLAAVAALVLIAGGGVALEREVGARPPASAAPGEARSGVWLCPHGGGGGWAVRLSLANPGASSVGVRLTGLSDRRPEASRSLAVGPGQTVSVDVTAQTREASTLIEYFGGWVAAGWVAHASGSGVAAEPCLGAGEGRLLLPDGETLEGRETYLVIMNPYASDAVVTVTLLTEQRPPVTHTEWSSLVLRGRRSISLHVNEKVQGERTVGAVVEVGVGRVGAASLVVSTPTGGLRSVVGIPRPTEGAVLPAAGDTGQSDLLVMNVTERQARFGATLLGSDGGRAIDGLEEVQQRATSARTYPVLVEGPTALALRALEGTPAVAAVRRTFGVRSDPATTAAGPPSEAWVVLPAVAGPPFRPGLVLANPGPEAAEVALTLLPPEGTAGAPDPVMVQVPPASTVTAPRSFVEALPGAAVLAVAVSGTFVPVAASNSLGQEGLAAHAVATGIPIPGPWVLGGVSP